MLLSLQRKVTGSHKINTFGIRFLIWFYPHIFFFPDASSSFFLHVMVCKWLLLSLLLLSLIANALSDSQKSLSSPCISTLDCSSNNWKYEYPLIRQIFLTQLSISHIVHIVSNFPSTLSSILQQSWNFIPIKFCLY